MVLLKVEDLKKSFGKKEVLRGVNFEIEKGKVYGLLGPNGAGKSTTLKIITGIIPSDSGKIIVDGEEIGENDIDYKRKIGFLPEQPYIYPYLTGMEFLIFVKRVFGRGDIEKWVFYFEMEDYMDTLIKDYSHGLKQRLILVSIFMRSPKIYLFDEPTVGLDPLTIKKLREAIREETKMGKCFLLSTHLLSNVEEVADRVGIINKGRIVMEESVSFIRDRMKKKLEDIYFEVTRNGSSDIPLHKDKEK